MIIEVLQTAGFSAPTKSNLDAWINTYSLPVTSLIDPPSKPKATFDTYGGREQVFVLDMRTMKILRYVQGSLAGSGDSSVKQVTPFLMDLLSKA